MSAVAFANVRPVDQSRVAPSCCLLVDFEEDFDWSDPGLATGYSTAAMARVVELHAVTAAYRLRPIHLLTYPVLDDPAVVAVLRREVERGACEVGLQLHPWVTPPLDPGGREPSYLGQLPAARVRAKLLALHERFGTVFGFAPTVFRAGRYGLSTEVAELLEELGFEIDTSVAPRTDVSGEGGPDFSGYTSVPFWFGRRRTLLELPLCRDLVGWGGALAPRLYGGGGGRWRGALLGRSRCVERITLSPEGNDHAAMRRLIAARRRRGERIFPVSFHSSSLAPGRNPYVRSRADLHRFYDRLSATLDFCAREGMAFRAVSEVRPLLEANR